MDDWLEDIYESMIEDQERIVRHHKEEKEIGTPGIDSWLDDNLINPDAFLEELQQFDDWLSDRESKIDEQVQNGEISEFQGEVYYDQLKEKRRKFRTRKSMNALNLDYEDLGDISYDNNHILREHEHPEFDSKVRDIRELLKKVPWQEREEVLRELKEEAGIDDETFGQLMDEIE